MAKKALLAGKHVVCEKPLAITAAEAGELVELAGRTGLVNALHFNVRYYPLIRQVKIMAAKKEMGRIFSIHGSYLQDWLFYETDYNWRLEPQFSGTSRAVADIGSHWMDLVEYVSGSGSQRSSPTSRSSTRCGRGRSSRSRPTPGKLLKPEDYDDVQIDTEDYASMLFRFENGENGSLMVSQVSAGRKNRIYFEIDGSRKSADGTRSRPTSSGSAGGTATTRYHERPFPRLPGGPQLISFPGGHKEGFPDTSKFFKEFYPISRGTGGRPQLPHLPRRPPGTRALRRHPGERREGRVGRRMTMVEWSVAK